MNAVSFFSFRHSDPGILFARFCCDYCFIRLGFSCFVHIARFTPTRVMSIVVRATCSKRILTTAAALPFIILLLEFTTSGIQITEIYRVLVQTLNVLKSDARDEMLHS